MRFRDLLRRLAPALPILLASALFAPGLSAPPYDAHHVRQCETAAYARELARGGPLAVAGRERVGTHAPLYEGIVAAGWRAVGGEPSAWPRVVSVLAWLGAAVSMGAWGRRRLGLPAGLGGVAMLLSPLALVYARNVQPEALAAALAAIALERADAAEGRPLGTVLAAAAIGLAGAIDPALLALLAVVVLLPARPGRAVSALAALVAIGLPAAAWTLFPVVSSMPPAGSSAAVLRSVAAPLLLDGLTPIGAALVAVGALRPDARSRPMLAAFFVALVLAVVRAPRIAGHSYLLLSMLPFASLLAARGAAVLLAGTGAARARSPSFAGAVAGLLAALLFGSVFEAARYLPSARRLDPRPAAIGAAAAAVVPAGGAVVVVDRHPQSLLYALDRPGWARTDVALADLARFEARGANAVLVTDTSLAWADAGLRERLLARRRLAAHGTGWVLLRLDLALPRLDG